MNKVFVAFPFKPRSGPAVRKVVDRIGRLIKSHGLVPATGESLGGNSLTPAVKKLIAESDALIALLTREERISGKNKWLASDWVKSEITTGRAIGKPAIALVEPEVDVKGLFAENEYIVLDLNKPLETLLQLSETIRVWKEETGRYLLVRLLPDAAAAAAQNRNSECRIRLVPPNGAGGGWQKGEIRILPGGVFVGVPSVKENVALDVQIVNDGGLATWKSGEFPQWVHVEMRSV
jgi:hypothetical protein